jgi:hypothetical protein
MRVFRLACRSIRSIYPIMQFTAIPKIRWRVSPTEDRQHANIQSHIQPIWRKSFARESLAPAVADGERLKNKSILLSFWFRSSMEVWRD